MKVKNHKLFSKITPYKMTFSFFWKMGINHITPLRKTKSVDSTLCLGSGFLLFGVGIERGLNGTFGPKWPILLSTHFVS